MMTPDKDFGQLVDHQYFFSPTSRHLWEMDVRCDGPKANLVKKWDKSKNVWIKCGICSDWWAMPWINIPESQGIGQKKTAVKLSKEIMATVEETHQKHWQNLKGKQKENGGKLCQTRESYLRNWATIKTRRAIDFIHDDLKYDGIDEEKLRTIFTDSEIPNTSCTGNSKQSRWKSYCSKKMKAIGPLWCSDLLPLIRSTSATSKRT